jgi:diguanylate cyclase (GGDEF)-like protein
LLGTIHQCIRISHRVVDSYGILAHHDLAGRFGGEEFTILLPETDLAAAAVFAERLRATIANLSLHFDQQSVAITVSIGVTPPE